MSPSLESLKEQFTRLVGAAATTATPPAPPPPAPVAAPAPAGTPVTAAAAAPAAPAPAPVGPIQEVNFALKGFHLDVTVAPDQLVAAAGIADAAGFALDTITGVDWLAQEQMEVVYDFCHFSSPLRVVVRTRVSRANPEVPTILGVFPGANWHERETHDFFGIRFTGHPNLTPFLLPEDADYHPLRKDYKP
jgi:NADH-quinone oxidoreductase subunit C